MKELIARWKTESPTLFKNIGLFGKFLIGAGAVIAGATLTAPELISEKFIIILKSAAEHMIFGGTIILGISKLTVKDYSELEEKMNK